jgi:glucuronate isomerase
MKPFMDKDFLLSSNTAKSLYHNYAENLPIIDYHCHINPEEIAKDRRFENITKLWLGGDHYKWRLMRAAGVDEFYITGDASDHDKFLKYAEVLGKAIGNPLYHWSHLELQRYFGYNGILNAETAETVWEICNEKLAQPEMSVRNIIKKSNVEVICTTDDPADSLEWHKLIAEDKSFNTAVYPAWRPDKYMNIESKDFFNFVSKLSDAAKIKIECYEDLKNALKIRMEFFAKNGCRISDHGLEYVAYSPADDNEIESIFLKKKNDGILSMEEIKKYKTSFMLFCAGEYKRLGWVMQLHYGCKRNNNSRMFENIGPDTGYDCIDNYAPASEMADFLNSLEKKDLLPKTIVYSLNPNDNQVIDTVIGCFQGGGEICKIQHGSAWWFNDNLPGIKEHLVSLANYGYLAGFIGMLTDSRSFLSYPRHEYFRRILCGLLGKWVEDGEFPEDMKLLGEIVTGICYGNAKKYFNF